MASVRKRTWTSGGKEHAAWLLEYKDGEGKRRFRTFERQKDAKAALVDIVGEVRDGKHTPLPKTITVREAGELWIARGVREGLERSTLENYRETVRLHINPAIGGIKLADLKTARIEAFKDELLDKGSAKAPKALARKVIVSLKGILKEAQRLTYIAHDPAGPVRVGAAKGRTKRKLHVGTDTASKAEITQKAVIPSKAEIRAILKAAENYPPESAHRKGKPSPWRPLLVTAVFTGMRASELRGLTWDAVDFAGETIHVYQRADRWGDMGDPKSEAGDREIPMSPEVLKTLKAWKLACPKKGSLNLVFPTTEGNVHRHSNISFRVWGAIQKAAGVTDAAGKPKYRFHLLRHFAASWMIEQGFTPKRLQMLMGHSNIGITMNVYGHLFPSPDDDKAKFAAAESSIIG